MPAFVQSNLKITFGQYIIVILPDLSTILYKLYKPAKYKYKTIANMGWSVTSVY